MGNRNQRRAIAAVEKKLPEVPNISGDPDKSCASCAFSADPEVHAKVIAALQRRHDLLGGEAAQRPVTLTDTKVICFYNPGGGIHMFNYGYCSKFKPKT